MNIQIEITPKNVAFNTLSIDSVNVANGEAYVVASLRSADLPLMFSYNVVITPEEYELWGTDDNYIVDLVLEKLEISRG